MWLPTDCCEGLFPAKPHYDNGDHRYQGRHDEQYLAHRIMRKQPFWRWHHWSSKIIQPPPDRQIPRRLLTGRVFKHSFLNLIRQKKLQTKPARFENGSHVASSCHSYSTPSASSCANCFSVKKGNCGQGHIHSSGHARRSEKFSIFNPTRLRNPISLLGRDEPCL